MRIPKYRRHSSGRAFVEVNGHRHYFLGDFNSPESWNAYIDWLRKNDFPIIRKGEPILVWQLCQGFLVHADEYYGPTHAEQHHYRSLIRVMKSTHFLKAELFGPAALKAVRNEMIAKDWSRGYVNDQIQRLRRMFRWAISEELVRPAVLDALRAVDSLRKGHTSARETAPKQPVPWDDVRATLDVLPPTLQAMVLTQWHTGCRPQNVCHLRPSELNRQSNVWEWKPVSHKTELTRPTPLVIYVGPLCQEVLKPFLDRDPDAYCFSPKEATEWRLEQRRRNAKVVRKSVKGGWKTHREHYDTGSYRTAVQRAQTKAEIEVWAPHQLRHSRGTAVREKYGVEAAQGVLGHESVDATLIYARKLSIVARKAALETG